MPKEQITQDFSEFLPFFGATLYKCISCTSGYPLDRLYHRMLCRSSSFGLTVGNYSEFWGLFEIC